MLLRPKPQAPDLTAEAEVDALPQGSKPQGSKPQAPGFSPPLPPAQVLIQVVAVPHVPQTRSIHNRRSWEVDLELHSELHMASDMYHPCSAVQVPTIHARRSWEGEVEQVRTSPACAHPRGTPA